MGRKVAGDEGWMRMALEEARRDRGHASPNPAVGAVIVKRGRLLARGYHARCGAAHAEVEALDSLRPASRARGAELFVTLEPCSSHGRTPPCTEAIIAAGISRVVYGATDPDPRHRGRAARLLRRAGIEVVRGVLETECKQLNEAWRHWISTGLPFVIAKAGMSLDGRIGSPPARRWITGPQARADAMNLRARVDAILVGAATVREDNPRLTLRGHPGHRQPLRVVWTRTGRLPTACHLLKDRFQDRTLVCRRGSLREVLRALGRRGVTSVLIEGGGKTLGAAFDQGLVDRVVFYVAPKLIGGFVPAVGGRGVGSNRERLRLESVTFVPFGGDVRITGDVVRTQT